MTSGVQTEGSGQGSSFDSNTQPVVTPSGQIDVDNCTDEELDRALAAAEAKRLRQKKRDRLTALLRGEDPDEQPADTSARPGKRLRESTWWKPSMSTLRYKASSWAELKVFTFEVKNRCAIDSSNTETEVDRIRYATSYLPVVNRQGSQERQKSYCHPWKMIFGPLRREVLSYAQKRGNREARTGRPEMRCGRKAKIGCSASKVVCLSQMTALSRTNCCNCFTITQLVVTRG
ncbi:uncharacterized protein BCR38DRAFT_181767 [Pseudomassariella vexata]|uniref:Uncharacterized protein n=1 Tax=Pseudomassariella vexata TaxID=1141098 RepID=A0A1Y2E6K1_9PEZI|nr:uncharacterized protein BCR38DRAFT_181767 [Pseudomassariella vexata]ORY66495.1 hypothetical protein BCR38DRAFT_181767 [Pseudomassariella vexata]